MSGPPPGTRIIPEYPPEVRDQFLDCLAIGLTALDGAEAVGVPIRTLYRWKEENEEFGKAWKRAYQIGNQALEKEAKRRAVEGTQKPVFHQGEVCGWVNEYSDTLLMFLMKARDPQKFCDRTRTAEIEREIANALAASNSNATTTAADIVDRLIKLAAEKAATAENDKPE